MQAGHMVIRIFSFIQIAGSDIHNKINRNTIECTAFSGPAFLGISRNNTVEGTDRRNDSGYDFTPDPFFSGGPVIDKQV